MPRSTGIPTALRPSQSRDNLAAAPEIKPSRLRPAASRERLAPPASASGISNTTNEPSPTASKNSPFARSLPRPRPTSSLPTFSPQPKLPKASSNSNGNGLSRIPPPRDRMASLPEDEGSPRESQTSRLPGPGLRRKSSAQWISSSQSASARQRSTSVSTLSNGYASSDSFSQNSPIGEDNDGAGDETIRAKTLKARPSLAERTVQTLSRLPSTPSLRGRASNSNFFELEPHRSASRPASRGSRPGSSLRNENPYPASSKPSLSRPGSSSGPLQDLSNPFNPQLPSFDNSPSRGRRISSLRTPSTSGLREPSRSKIAGLQRPRSTTPNTEVPSLAPETPVDNSKTLSTRTIQPRPSVNGLFKKPALPAAKKPASISSAPNKAKTASLKSPATVSDRSTNLSAASSNSTNTTSVGGDSPPPFKKSSAALRDQIARAKAAKRSAATQKAPVADEPGQTATWGESPVVPTDDTFDFGLSDDPFNLNRDANSTSKIVKSRVTTARTSGRLNIAALSLKEIPKEVLDMYSLESIGKHDGSWAESVDLTRFVAADNELEMIDESVFPDIDPEELAEDEDAQGSIFAGLETLDLHGNMLIALPAGLRRLTLLTSLNLSSNRLANNCLEPISQIISLRDVKLGGNLFWGTLEPCFGQLINLEILDLHGNSLQSLPPRFTELHRLRILNVSENSFESLPFDVLSKLPLTELNARKNKLTGTLIDESVEVLPALQNLDVSSNQLTSLARPNAVLAMPALTHLCVSMNRLQALPDVTSWFELINLAADENNIKAFPDGFTSLQKLRGADFSSNDIRTVPAEIARMTNLNMLRLSGNPLRDKKFVSATIEELKDALAARMAPPPTASDDYDGSNGPIAEALTSNEVSPLDNAFDDAHSSSSNAVRIHGEHDEESRTDTDDFATPPTSVPTSPIRTRSAQSSALVWPVRAGGVLDRSNTQSSSLHPVACSNLAMENTIREIQLHHNLFTALPESLSFFVDSLTTLSLAHNQLVGESYLNVGEGLDLPSLKELNLSSNHITGLTPLVNRLQAPRLEKLDVSINRLASLPSSSDKEKGGKLLRDVFPNLTVLLIANNHIADLDPESIRGMKVVDASNNDIAHLNPRIGLLGGAGGLEQLIVTGNRFRVPRWNVLERGTEATLRFLRGRVPVADMAAWRAEKGIVAEEDVSDVD
ncbi:hypothetical protein J7T55_004271 [Diaporthe amygdali]|uniref:uncharacterized protein n=1 Tax=Phomopsis amygdali TaxID=1214568 RepID=UPI0022FE7585|nr:uncharacterized protein J7T55_004271 [Diaporthe amygdali]KAJ0109722.1 hypothetical protein J7T55_004271 [Diaporthe amygdali]